MYSTTVRHSQKMSVVYRLMVPNHPVMQVAPDHHPPTPPSGATALASTYAPTTAIRDQPPAVSEQRLMPGAGAESLDLLIDRIGVRISYAPKSRIFHENDAAESVYEVVSGSVCTCKFLSDGRRQIGGFYLPGDFLDLSVPTRIVCQRKHSRTLR
jgi:hypothetical protein